MARAGSPKKGRKSVKQAPVEVQHNPRLSTAYDMPDPIYQFIDPISVSLQERVKFGGHISSITKRHQMKIPFYFQLSEAGPENHVSQFAKFAAQVEIEENSDLGVKVTCIKKDIIDKKAMDRDYSHAVQAKEIIRVEAEYERRTRDLSSM